MPLNAPNQPTKHGQYILTVFIESWTKTKNLSIRTSMQQNYPRYLQCRFHQKRRSAEMHQTNNRPAKIPHNKHEGEKGEIVMGLS